MIEIKDLYFSYGRKSYILNGLNLSLNAGEYLSVVGENGCGKSTLMRLILQLLKPTFGTINCLAQNIGYVPQKKDFLNASFPITVSESLNAYRKILGLKNKNVIEEVLEKVGMLSFKYDLVGTLSGGQSQKIFIARALLGAPELLVLDEPSTGIDANSQIEIYRLLHKINTEFGTTIVSVEHNLLAAIANSTLIYHLVKGNGHICTPKQYSLEQQELLFKGNGSHDNFSV